MSQIVAAHTWSCEVCSYTLYDKNEMVKHLKAKHGIDVSSPLANSGMAGDNLIVSDCVIPANTIFRSQNMECNDCHEVYRADNESQSCPRCGGKGTVMVDLFADFNRAERRKRKNDSQQYKQVPCPDCKGKAEFPNQPIIPRKDLEFEGKS